MHLLATFLVAFGTTMSAFWILALNSWMQTPGRLRDANGGVHSDRLVGGGLQPQFPYRLVHMLLASG
jgi:cytochrome d ubiquinol oxidase subunit I